MLLAASHESECTNVLTNTLCNIIVMVTYMYTPSEKNISIFNIILYEHGIKNHSKREATEISFS